MRTLRFGTSSTAFLALALLCGCSNDGQLDFSSITSTGGDASASGRGTGDASDASDASDDATIAGNNGGDAATTAADAGEDAGPGCDNALMLTVRDFDESHEDFENRNAYEDGIVEEDLGADGKPVYAHTGSTSATEGPDEFAQWYRDTPGVNQTFSHEIRFDEDPQTGTFVYDDPDFFPLDGMGFGNGPGGADHNFLFTTEAHTRFTYSGGEEFTFSGDDDLWIFINGKLAIDLGGVHGELTETIRLDDEAAYLGIEPGNSYRMDIFHAERHTWASHFRIQTTIDLSCIENVPPII